MSSAGILLWCLLAAAAVVAPDVQPEQQQQQKVPQKQEQQEEQQVLQEDRVKVYSLQRGAWRASTDDVFLRFNFSKASTPVMQLSVCYRIRFEMFVEDNTHVSYATTFDNHDPFSLGHRENLFSSWFIQGPLDGQLPGEVLPEVWYHVCHLLQENAYTLYWQGQEVYRGPSRSDWPFPMNGTLVVGQEQDTQGGGFDATQIHRGDITQLSLWDRLLDAGTIRQMASCRTTSAGRGNLFSSDATEMEVFGVEERWVETALLCRTEPRYVILPEERSHRAARAVCSLLNATLAIPSSSRDNQLLTEQLFHFRNTCNPTALWKLWLGVDIREKSVALTETITGRPISYTNFSPTTSVRGSVLRCTALRVDGFWETEYCHETVKRCAACSFESTDFLRLRGLCFDSEMRTRFRVQASRSGRPFFRGYYGLLITWVVETSRWQLVDPATNATLMWAVGVGSNAYPIGRREWKLLKETCEITADQTVSLSLSVCGQEHFMCDSGECIDYDRRCNHRNDCRDQSDEMNCNVVDNGDEFQRQMPPTGAQGGVLSLISSLSLSRIANVDDMNMAVDLEFQFILTWTDDRLRLKHLKESKNGTILTDDESRKVWRPVYHIMNLDGGHMKLLGQSFLVKTARNAIPPSFNDVDMDVTYPGSANELSFTQRYSVRVTCNFQLYAYPFDVQLCKIDIRLPLEYDGYVQFAAAEGATISYTGPQNLAMYTIRNLWTASSELDRFVVQFELHRRQGVILLSTFVPSGLLLLVSWSTLFVKLEALNVRAIMSLTTLLVLYTLFANMSSSLPTTASIKLIDVWFFFIIFLLFVNIVIHIFVDRKTLRKDERQKIFVRDGQTQPRGSSPSSDLLPTNLRFLNYYRFVILPVLIVLFNVAFWSAVFAQ